MLRSRKLTHGSNAESKNVEIIYLPKGEPLGSEPIDRYITAKLLAEKIGFPGFYFSIGLKGPLIFGNELVFEIIKSDESLFMADYDYAMEHFSNKEDNILRVDFR